MSKRDDPQLRVRIPAELKNALEIKAKANKRTLTAEIVDRLEATNLQDSERGSNTGYAELIHEYVEISEELSQLQEQYDRAYSLDYYDAHKDELRAAVKNLHNVLNPHNKK